MSTTSMRPALTLTFDVEDWRGVLLSAGYMLWAMQRVFLGKPRPEQATLAEVTQREAIVLTPLAAMCVLLGILPAVFVFAFTNGTVEALMKVLR